MKPEIENLKAWMSGKSTTRYQRALAMREFEQLLTYVAELEQLRQPPVIGSVCHDCLMGMDEFEPDWKCPACRQTDR
jgi:rubrerythrin